MKPLVPPITKGSRIQAALQTLGSPRARIAKAPTEEEEEPEKPLLTRIKKTIKPPKSGGIRLLGGSGS
jgi:hypothetical protein